MTKRHTVKARVDGFAGREQILILIAPAAQVVLDSLKIHVEIAAVHKQRLICAVGHLPRERREVVDSQRLLRVERQRFGLVHIVQLHHKRRELRAIGRVRRKALLRVLVSLNGGLIQENVFNVQNSRLPLRPRGHCHKRQH